MPYYKHRKIELTPKRLSKTIALAILFLVLVLTISYRQIIYEYPDGGGAYVVS
jgi:hypothetical protein